MEGGLAVRHGHARQLLASGGDDADAHPNLFALQGHVDWVILTIMIIALVLFTMAWEATLDRVDHRAAGTKYEPVVGKVYKELAILGFVSFAVLVVHQFTHLPQVELLMFEFAHVWIFVVALVFVAHALVYLGLSLRQKRNWDKMDRHKAGDLLRAYARELAAARREVVSLGGSVDDVPDPQGQELSPAMSARLQGPGAPHGRNQGILTRLSLVCCPSRQAYHRGTGGEGAPVRPAAARCTVSRLVQAVFCPRRPLLRFGYGPRWYYVLFGRGRLLERMEFKLLKLTFLEDNSVPKQFDYSKYLRRSLSEAITEALEVDVSTWLLLLATFVVNLLRLMIETGDPTETSVDDEPSSDAFLSMFGGVFILLLDWVLLLETRRGKDRVLKLCGCRELYQVYFRLQEMADPAAASLRARSRRATINAQLASLPRLPLSTREVAGGSDAIATFRRARHVASEARRTALKNAISRTKVFHTLLEYVMLLQCFGIALIILLVAGAHVRGSDSWVEAAALVGIDLGPSTLVLLFLQPRVLKNYTYLQAITDVEEKRVEEILQHMEAQNRVKKVLADILATDLTHRIRIEATAAHRRGRGTGMPFTERSAPDHLQVAGDAGGESPGRTVSGTSTPLGTTRNRRLSRLLLRHVVDSTMSEETADRTMQHLLAIFDEINKSGSGHLSLSEVHQYMRLWQTEVSNKEMKMLWRAIDRHADGGIDFHEFCDLCLSATNISRAARAGHHAAQVVTEPAATSMGAASNESFFFGSFGGLGEITTLRETEGSVSEDARRCFRGSSARCELCRKMVPVVQVETHAAECAADHPAPSPAVDGPQSEAEVADRAHSPLEVGPDVAASAATV